MLTTTTIFAFAWKFLAVFLVVVAVLDLLTMTQPRKVRLYRNQGLSQKAIANRLGISVYQVRKALTPTTI